jgi:gastric triacylglycerol lipase
MNVMMYWLDMLQVIILLNKSAGTSTKNLLYFRQLAINNRFERYDYGKALNLRIYGKPTPPEFDLGKIDIPVYFIAGNEDLLADPVDVNALVAGLTKSPKVWVKFYKAGHCSYMWGREMPFYEDLF